jgi:hypothetical protein
VPLVDGTGQQVSGLPPSNPNLQSLLTLDASTIANAGVVQYARSFTRGGFEYVYDHQSWDPGTSTGEPNANNSGKIQRAVTSGPITVARLLGTVGSEAASLNADQLTLLRRLVPAEFNAAGVYTPESGTHLVAFGVGPNCRLVPTTMLNTPTYPGADGKYYGRYVAIVKLYASGERPTLVAVTDAYGRTSDYTIQQFNESLPNGARQG